MVTILDGGMGQELVKRCEGPAPVLWGTQVLLDRPELVRTVHDEYFAAGATIATTNSYSAHRDRMDPEGAGHLFEATQHAACRIAVEARDAHGSGIVAGSIGPLDGSYIGDDGPPRQEAARLFSEVARIQRDYVDVLLAESVPSVARAQATLDGLEGHGLPVWIAFTVDDQDGTKLRSGEPVEAIIDLLKDRQVDAVLVNCSSPEAVSQALGVLGGRHPKLGAYANGFVEIPYAYLDRVATVDLLSAREDLMPTAYADFVAQWIDLGAEIVGGCCEVGPLHIRELHSRFGNADSRVDSVGQPA